MMGMPLHRRRRMQRRGTCPGRRGAAVPGGGGVIELGCEARSSECPLSTCVQRCCLRLRIQVRQARVAGMAAMHLRPAMHSRFALPCTSRRQRLQDPHTERVARALELTLPLVLALICLQPAAHTQQTADSAPATQTTTHTRGKPSSTAHPFSMTTQIPHLDCGFRAITLRSENFVPESPRVHLL